MKINMLVEKNDRLHATVSNDDYTVNVDVDYEYGMTPKQRQDIVLHQAEIALAVKAYSMADV